MPEFERLKNSTSVSIAGPRDPAEANVTARLFKSNPVKNALPGIMSGIRAVLGLEDAPTNKTGGETGHKDGGRRREDTAKQQAHGEESDSESEGGNSASEDVSMDDAEQQSVDYAQFDGRLASSSSDDGSESEDESDTERRSKPGAKPERYDAAADLSISPSPSPSRSASESPPPSKVKGRKKKAGADGPAKATTFLPSLMSGYWSGSESGGDVDDDTRPRRKNRMGQRARRALWEKKYGDKANHLQKQKQQQGKESRDKGWDPRKGATDEDDSGKPKWGKQRAQPAKNEKKEQKPQQQQQKEKQPKKPAEDKPLHPSWEAARKAKEQTAQASFQGKKIVFD